MINNADEIELLFLSSDDEERRVFLEQCPNTIRKPLAISLIGKNGVLSDLQALQILSEDLVLQERLTEGTEMIKACYEIAKILFADSEDEETKVFLRGVVGMSALTLSDAFLKEGYVVESVDSAQSGINWLENLPTLRPFDSEQKGSLQLKQVEAYLEAGNIDSANTVLNSKIETNILSVPQTMTFQTLKSRVESTIIDPDIQNKELSKADFAQPLIMLKAMIPMLPQFVSLGFVDASIEDRVNELIRIIENSEKFDVAFASELSEVIKKLQEITSKEMSFN